MFVHDIERMAVSGNEERLTEALQEFRCAGNLNSRDGIPICVLLLLVAALTTRRNESHLYVFSIGILTIHFELDNFSDSRPNAIVRLTQIESLPVLFNVLQIEGAVLQ